MKKTLLFVLALYSLSSLAQVSGGSGPGNSSARNMNLLYECYGTAIMAAKSIDSVNFPSLDQSSVMIDAEVQKMNSAKITVSIGNERNRIYTIKIIKNRSASLVGNGITTEPGCFVESVN